jgi:hypothetical protein
MKKCFAAIALLVALAIPVGAQSVDFLARLMKAVVEEFGIERVIGTLEDLGYIGEGEVAVGENITQETSVSAIDLTVRSAVWDDPDGEETLVYMVESDDASCYSYIGWGRDTGDTLAERMQWRSRFISSCIGR